MEQSGVARSAMATGLAIAAIAKKGATTKKNMTTEANVRRRDEEEKVHWDSVYRTLTNTQAYIPST